MAQTQTTVTNVWALLADNASGSISAQDLRDALETWRPRHGQIYVAAADSASVTINNTTNYFEVTEPAWSVSAGTQYECDESAGNGRLTYIGSQPIMVHIACTVSLSCGSNNQDIYLRLGVSGTTDVASEAQRKLAGAGDIGSTALHLVAMLSNGDYISLFVRNGTSSADVTVEVANLQFMSMPM